MKLSEKELQTLRVHGPTGWCVDSVKGIVYGAWQGHRGRPIGYTMSRGYLASRGLNQKDWLLHRVIWETVHGLIPDGLEINHKNGKRQDNRIANLEVVTHKENVHHAYRTGLIDPEKHLRNTPKGEQHGQAVITQAIADRIRAQKGSGESQRTVARRFRISQTTVWAIWNGSRWTR